ncbi:MAG: DUF3300 domain-containing protein, partial [Bryobacteraceae bacterium]
MQVNRKVFRSSMLGAILAAACAAAPLWAQGQEYPPPPQYPPAQQYPPPQQYPAQQGQYPAAPQPYPAPPPQYPSANAPPPLQSPQQLERLVSVIALYPDPLLAQVLTASSYADQIPQAAAWASEHRYLQGPQLAAAIQQDQLPWDPSVIALLPFPAVLEYMAENIAWTEQLGDAVLVQRPEVMNAVQTMRSTAYQYGYLRSGPYQSIQVAGPDDIQILPVAPGYVYVPYYNPNVVFVRPRPGFSVGAAIRLGPRVTLGAAFTPWGWGHASLGWSAHEIVIGGHPWGRTWQNRRAYVNRYAPAPHYSGRARERHNVREHERADQKHERARQKHERDHE